MSAIPHDDNDDVPEQPDPEQLVTENRDLVERLAAADLPISNRLQAALDAVEEVDDDG